MSRSFFLLILFCWALPAASSAQNLIQLPPGDLACSIKVTFHGYNAAPPASAKPTPAPMGSMLKEASIVSTGKMLYMEVSRYDNNNSQVWSPASLNLTFFKDAKNPRINSTRGSHLYPPVFYLNRVPLWYSWLTPDSFKEDVDYGGTPCKRYEKSVRIPSPSAEFPDGTATYQLWIHAATLQPLAFDDGSARYDLTFSAPTSSPALPEEAQKELARYQELLAPSKTPR